MGLVDPSGNLHVELDCKDCDPSGAELARMQRGLDTLSRVVADFPHADLYVTLIHHPRSNDYHVKTSVILPSRTLFTGDRDVEFYPAWERCLGKLVRKVEAYKARMSREAERSHFAQGTEHEVIASREPDADAIDAAITDDDYLAFRTATYPYEEAVWQRVGRWIQRYPEMQALVGDAFEIADVVEEVFILAFDHFDRRPPNVMFGDWLESLIDSAIHALAEHPDEAFHEIDFLRTERERVTQLREG